MRLVHWLGVFAIAACKAKQPGPKPEAVTPTNAISDGSTDLWNPAVGSAGSAGSAEPVPTWAYDPPKVLRDKINGVNAHIIVLASPAQFPEYRNVLSTVERMPGVAFAEPFIFLEGQLSSATKPAVNIALKAVDPTRVGRVLTVGQHMKTGTMESLAKDASGEPPPIVLGDGLARTLAVKIGDDVTATPSEATAKPKPFRVAGTFHMEFDEYDDKLAFASLASVQAMLGRGDEVMGIEATVKDLATSEALAKEIESKLGGPPYHVQDWYELNNNLFTALYGTRRP